MLLALVFLLLAMRGGLAADCSGEGVAAARAAFKIRYHAADYSAARDILSGLWSDCFIAKPDGVAAAEIASDLAIAAHRAGDSDECLQTLADFMPGFRDAERRLAALPERLRKAIAFNIRLCARQCPGPGPGCLTLRVAQAHAKLARGEFTSAALCKFDAGEGAVALSRDLCLWIEPPEREVDLAERETANPAEMCPPLSLVGRDGRKRRVALPAVSWLRNVETCCAEVSIETAADGRVRIAPAENPPEGCLSGKRSFVAEDVFRLGRGTLHPVSRALIGVR